MAKSTKIKWPPPPERNASHQYVGVRAVELLAEYQRVKGKKAKFARREELVIKAEALDLIEIMGAPWRLTELFDIMLGGPRSQVFYMQDAYPWVAEGVDYEARAHEEGRVSNKTGASEFGTLRHVAESPKACDIKTARQISRSKPSQDAGGLHPSKGGHPNTITIVGFHLFGDSGVSNKGRFDEHLTIRRCRVSHSG